MGADFAAEREDCREIDLEDLVPVVIWELMGWVSSLDAAAIEQDVDAVTVLQNLGYEGCD